MTTMEADPNASRLAAVRTLLSGAEWTRVAAMVGVIVALHLIGWVTLAALSSHAFIEASAHTMASSPTASWFEYLSVGRARHVRALGAEHGKVVPQDPALVSMGRGGGPKYAFE